MSLQNFELSSGKALRARSPRNREVGPLRQGGAPATRSGVVRKRCVASLPIPSDAGDEEAGRP